MIKKIAKSNLLIFLSVGWKMRMLNKNCITISFWFYSKIMIDVGFNNANLRFADWHIKVNHSLYLIVGTIKYIAASDY